MIIGEMDTMILKKRHISDIMFFLLVIANIGIIPVLIPAASGYFLEEERFCCDYSLPSFVYRVDNLYLSTPLNLLIVDCFISSRLETGKGMVKWLLGILLLLGSLVGCADERRESSLIDRAELLFGSRPDSSLVLLDSVSLPEELDDRSLVRWCMLYGRVADTLYVDLPLPEPFKQAYAYLKSHGTPHEQARMGLYLGRAYMADKEYERAMKIYKESLQTALRHEDYNQAGYISSYTADLYDYEGNYVFAKEKYAEAEAYFREAGNLRSAAYALRDQGRMYVFNDSTEMALPYILRADTILTAVGDSSDIAYIANALGNVYKKLGDMPLAKRYFWQAINFSDEDRAPDYSALAGIYIDEGDFTNARICLERAQEEPIMNKKTPSSIIYKYYRLEKAEGSLDKALAYLESYNEIADSVWTLRERENVIEVEKKYEHLQVSLDNMRLRMRQKNLFISLVILIAVCLFILSAYFIVIGRKNKKIYAQRIDLAHKNNELLRLREALERTRKELRELGVRDDTKEAYERLKGEEARLIGQIAERRKALLLSSAIAKRIDKLVRKIEPGKDASLTDKDWRNILAEVESVYPAFDRKLSVFNLTTAELSYCYLTLFCLDTKAESILLNILPDSVNKTRHRVRQKLGLVGKETDLYTFLISLS